MRKLLFFIPVRAPFVMADYEILRKKFNISLFYFKVVPKWITPLYCIIQFFFLVIKLPGTRVMFSHFSGFHTFLPALCSRVFNIPHYIVLNGTECNNFPEINYGFINRPFLYWLSKKSLQWSSRLLPVSEALVRAEYVYAKTKYTHQGYTSFYRNVKTPFTVVYNGTSIDQFNIDPSIKRADNSFVTVASGLENNTRRMVKGLDLVIDLARKTPQYTYTFIGGNKPAGLDLPSNIVIMDFVQHHELSSLYNRHQYYLQLSHTEGFGVSVCEAMLSGCVPIVSNVGVLPMIAGEKGYVLMHKDPDLVFDLIRKAVLEYDAARIALYRQHIIDHFSLSLREEKLLATLALDIPGITS